LKINILDIQNKYCYKWIPKSRLYAVFT